MIKLLGQFKSKRDKMSKWVFEGENKAIIELALFSHKNQYYLFVPTHYKVV